MPKAPRKNHKGPRNTGPAEDERRALLRRIAELEEREAHARWMVRTVGVSIWEEDFSAVAEALGELRSQGVQDIRAWCAGHPEFVRHATGLVRVVSVNDATLRMFRASTPAELLGSLERVFLPETLGVFVEELATLAEGRPFMRAETVVRTLDGGHQ